MEPSVGRDRLPRLVYVGDVPIESTYHGSLLLYRLFGNYPANKLLIIETDLGRSMPERRLLKVEYRTLRVRFARLKLSRFSNLYSVWLFFSAKFRTRRAIREVGEFQPEAVVSVAHGVHWFTAFCLSKLLRVPLHLIAHDNIDQSVLLPGVPIVPYKSTFKRVYRAAKSRLCVSPYMEASYATRFGVKGTVLYPSRARETPAWETPPVRADERNALKIAFAGSINSGGYARLLRLLADSVRPNDEVVIFGPHSVASLKYWRLNSKNISLGGLLPSTELIQRLRRDFDIVFVPMSFDSGGHAENMRFSFPSKIADYTATGLPLLICAPEYSSAAQWAREHAPVAEVVTAATSIALQNAVSRLRSRTHRESLGKRALEVGELLFSHGRAEGTFHSALTS